MSDTQQLWISLVTSVWSPLAPGQELTAPDYQRISFPPPLDNGMLPSISISPLPDWPVLVGWEVWDAVTGGNYQYGADLLWPVGQGGGFTLVFDGMGMASQLNPDGDMS